MRLNIFLHPVLKLYTMQTVLILQAEEKKNSRRRKTIKKKNYEKAHHFNGTGTGHICFPDS